MRVCFSIGNRSGAVIEKLSKSADNVEFMAYDTIQEMVKESITRRIFFDRIVFSEKILNDPKQDLLDLNSYISEYSDSTSIVFIAEGQDMNTVDIFNSIFNSPLYTPVLVKRVAVTTILEFVRSDISELKAKYYTLDVKEVKTLTSKLPDENVEETVVEKPEKKGFLNSLFGGKKKNSKNLENQNVTGNVAKTVGNVGESVAENALEKGTAGFTAATTLGVTASMKDSQGDFEENANGFYENDGSVSGGLDSPGDEIHDNLGDSDILGIGDYGEQHVDTGFLDEDIESEIEKALHEEEYTDNYEEPVKEDFKNVVFEREGVQFDIKKGISIISGLRGLGCTTSIVDTSVMLSDEGNRVLIVDMDYIDSGILSFIDVEAFYKARSKGVYTEDGVSILSRGYGKILDSDKLVALLESIKMKYDYIFIDCPLDCINVLSSRLISMVDFQILVNGNRGSLLSAINILTDVDGDIEDTVYENSRFVINNKDEYFKDEVAFLRDICLFGRGNWCEKIM